MLTGPTLNLLRLKASTLLCRKHSHAARHDMKAEAGPKD